MISGIRNSSFLTNQMKQTQGTQLKYQQQISSGKKINKAKDDAAGLAISEKLLKEANTLKQHSNNYASQINANNIAEGALSGASSTLNDMYAGSIRSMNGIMSDSDKAAIEANNNALGASINQIASTTKFNESYVLEDYKLDINTMDAASISSEAASVSSKRSELGAKTNALEHSIKVNDITAENETAALSRKQDAEMEKAISSYRSQQTISQFQNKLLSNQMSSADGLVTRLFN